MQPLKQIGTSPQDDEHTSHFHFHLKQTRRRNFLHARVYHLHFPSAHIFVLLTIMEQMEVVEATKKEVSEIKDSVFLAFIMRVIRKGRLMLLHIPVLKRANHLLRSPTATVLLS